MSALLLASARKHFQDPGFFAPVVPDYLCRTDLLTENTDALLTESMEASLTENTDASAAVPHNGALAVMSREEWIAVSGLLEATAAVGLLIPATRKAAAHGTAVMFTAFLAGHVDALRRAYAPAGTQRERKIHTLRLPVQLPLILWAWSLAGRKRGR